MKAIIPMAGSGTRLRPLTHSRPKALLRVGSRPIIAHIIDALIPLGCDTVIPVVGRESGEAIVDAIRTLYPQLKVVPVVQKEKLGLGHAVFMAREAADGDEVIVMYGDTIIEGDLSGFTDRSTDGVIAVREVDDPRRFGVVNTVDGVIVKFVEKPDVPESHLAIVGFNYFKDSSLLFTCIEEIIERDIRTRGEYQLTDAFQLMVEKGATLKALAIDGWFDAGTPDMLLATNRRMLAVEGNTESYAGAVIVPPVYIGEGVSLDGSVVGPDVSIGDHTIIEHTVISDSIIGAHSIVRNAVLTGSLVGDHAVMDGSPRTVILGDHSEIRAGE